jgi:hypothetical protein
MTRWLSLFLAILLAGGCASQSAHTSPLKEPGMKPEKLEGTYEFLSDTIKLTKPEATTETRLPPEWIGVWLFQNGRFSQTLMKQKRSWEPFPSNHQELGYQSSTGTYRMDGPHLFLKHEFSLNPNGVSQLTVVEYKLEGDTLTLTTKMRPRIEDLSEGEQITVLRRIK